MKMLIVSGFHNKLISLIHSGSFSVEGLATSNFSCSGLNAIRIISERNSFVIIGIALVTA